MSQKIGPRELELRRMREEQLAGNKDDKKPVKAKAEKKAAAIKAVATANEKAQETPLPSPTTEEQTMPKKKKAKAANGNGHRKGTKSAKAVALLTRPQGASSKEVLKVTGWPTISMPAFAKTQGLKLRKEKTDDGLRYFGSR